MRQTSCTSVERGYMWSDIDPRGCQRGRSMMIAKLNGPLKRVMQSTALPVLAARSIALPPQSSLRRGRSGHLHMPGAFRTLLRNLTMSWQYYLSQWTGLHAACCGWPYLNDNPMAPTQENDRASSGRWPWAWRTASSGARLSSDSFSTSYGSWFLISAVSVILDYGDEDWQSRLRGMKGRKGIGEILALHMWNTVRCTAY